MPFTDEPSGTLGSKDLLSNPDVIRALKDFMPGIPSLDRGLQNVRLNALPLIRPPAGAFPWAYVFAIDGSNYETVTDHAYPHQVGYVKVGGVLTPLNDLFTLQQRDSVSSLDIEMLKRQRITAAVVLPGQNVVLPGENSVSYSFRRALHEFMQRPQKALPWITGERSFYDVLVDVVKNGQPTDAHRRLGLIHDDHHDHPLRAHCPRCHQALVVPNALFRDVPQGDRKPFEGRCKCGETLFLVDVMKFHASVMDTGSNQNLLNDVMLALEKLMALHWVQFGLKSSVLVLLDGPLSLFGDRQSLIPYMTSWLSRLVKPANPESPSMLPGLLGVSKHGQLAQHAQALHQRLPDLSAGVYPVSAQYSEHMLVLKTGKRPQTFDDRDRCNLGASHLVKTVQNRWYVVDTPVWHMDRKDSAFYKNPDTLFNPDHGRYWHPLFTAINRFDGPRYGGSLLPMTFAHELVSIARDPSGVVLTQRFRDTMPAHKIPDSTQSEKQQLQDEWASTMGSMRTPVRSTGGPV